MIKELNTYPIDVTGIDVAKISENSISTAEMELTEEMLERIKAVMDYKQVPKEINYEK